MRRIFTVSAVIAAFGACGVAAAQNTMDIYPTGLTLRGGVAVPIDQTLTNVGSALANIGLEFPVGRALLAGGESYIAADVFFKGFGGSGRGTVIPLTVNHRFYTSDELLRSYYFLGVGMSLVDVDGRGTALTVRGGVGQELGTRISAEIAAYLSDRAGGARVNAITFNLGYKF